MIARVASLLIVGFWIVMSTLLVRLEHDPDKSNLLTVPPSHVLKLMFMHEQVSELNIMENGKPAGNLTLHPRSDNEHDERTLAFTGGFSFRIPNAPKRQRISWDGTVEMDHAFNLRLLTLTTGLQDSPYRVHLTLDPLNKRLEYEIRQGTQLVNRSSTSLDAAGLTSMLRDDLGVDPFIVQNLPSGMGSVPTFTAKQTELPLHKEKVVCYLLTFKQGDTVLAEIYVSQLGQILTAKTLIGYTLSTEDMTPP